jgi:hypothetical protein
LILPSNHHPTQALIPIDDDDDFADTSDEEEARLDLSNVPIGSEIIHMPNGDVLVKAPVQATERDQDLFIIDPKGDREVLLTGSFYRGDIPKYKLHDGDKVTTSADLARKAYHRPSSATAINSGSKKVAASSSSKQSSTKESDRMPRNERYFMLSKNLLLSSSGIAQDIIQRRSKVRGPQQVATVSEGSGFIPTTPYNSIDGEIQAMKMMSADDKAKAYLSSDLSRYQSLAMNNARQLNTSIRTTSSSAEAELGVAWLKLVQRQNSLHQLQMLASGDPRHHRFIDYYPIERRYIVDKKLSLLHDAVAKLSKDADSNEQSSSSSLELVYAYYLSLSAAYEKPEKSSELWQQALSTCPLSYALRTMYLDYLNSTTSRDISITELREKYIASYRSSVNQFQNIEATRQLLQGISSNVIPAVQNSTSYSGNSELGALPINLQLDLEAYQIDLIHAYLQLEIEAGYLERAVAIASLLLDMNLSDYDPAHSDDAEKYWESEYPRLGESMSMEYCGLASWRKHQRPADGSQVFAMGGIPPEYTFPYTTASTLAPVQELAASSTVDSPTAAEDLTRYENIAEDEAREEEVVMSSRNDVNDTASKRKRAIDFFIETVDEENTDAANRRGFNDPVIETEVNAGADANEEVDGYRMVYSRIHGYRILMPVAPTSTDPAYSRALRILRPQSSHHGDDDKAVEIKPAPLNQTANELLDKQLLRELQHVYQHELSLSNMQYRPLRIFADSDVEAASRFPLR